MNIRRKDGAEKATLALGLALAVERSARWIAVPEIPVMAVRQLESGASAPVALHRTRDGGVRRGRRPPDSVRAHKIPGGKELRTSASRCAEAVPGVRAVRRPPAGSVLERRAAPCRGERRRRGPKASAPGSEDL